MNCYSLVVCIRCVWQTKFYGEIARQFGEVEHVGKSYMIFTSFSEIRGMKDPVFPVLVVPIVRVGSVMAEYCTSSLGMMYWQLQFWQSGSTGDKRSQEESREVTSLLTLRLWSQGIKEEQEHLLSKESSEVSRSYILAACCLEEAALDEVCIKHCLPSPSYVKKKAL